MLAGCARAGHPPTHAGALVIAIPQEPASLNPLYLEGILSYTIGELGYSYLTNYDSRGSVVPDLAAVPTLENGGISAGGMRVTYRLRHHLTWQDGAPLTSRDVRFSYRAIMNPSNAISSRYGYDQVASVETPDAYTAVVILKHPYSPIVSYFFGGDSNYPILPAHLLARYANLNRVAYDAAPIGSGPYRLSRWVRGDRLNLEANERYYAGKPAIARIGLRFVRDSSTTIDQLLTGEVDATFFADVSRIATLRTIPNHRVVVTPVPYFYAMPFNVTDPVVKDPTVRRAFALAIDRHALVDKVSHGLYDADTGMRGLFTWAFDPRAGNVPYDPQRARALLVRDGWIDGPGETRVKRGRRLAVPGGSTPLRRIRGKGPVTVRPLRSRPAPSSSTWNSSSSTRPEWSGQ
jgi:peptide/nickel transport system substrate-binding protein